MISRRNRIHALLSVTAALAMLFALTSLGGNALMLDCFGAGNAGPALMASVWQLPHR